MKFKISSAVTVFVGIGFLFSSCGSEVNSNKPVKEDTISVAATPVEHVPLWKELPKDSFRGMDTVNIHYKNYRLFALDSVQMQSLLLKAPRDNQRKTDSLKMIVALPKPDGTFNEFSIYSTSVMDPALEAKYPMMKTYAGQGVKDATTSVRLEFNQNGFNAYIKGQEGEWFIQPAAQGITHQYLVCFFKQDAVVPGRKSFELPGSPVK
jgi:hypothetical protein